MAQLPYSRASVGELPRGPGVYLFLDRKGRPVYVGKARDLRSRVRSYFGKTTDRRPVSQLLQKHAASLDFVLTGSEKEALILENSLIKRHAPRFNIRLRDDKTYFSLRLDLKETWPMLRIVRKRARDGALYFGPYTSSQACRRTLQHLHAVFPLRSCPDSVLANRARPCISFEIGRCVAPCVGLVERSRYMELVEKVIRFLGGQDQQVLAEIESEMLAAAERLEFERAAELRDRLRHIKKTLESPRLTRPGSVDRDVLGLYEGQGEIVLTVLHLRQGNLTASSSFRFVGRARESEVLGAFLGQFYGPEHMPPPEILLPGDCADPGLYRELLEERRGAAVVLKVPERGEGLRLLRLAESNAALLARRRRKDDELLQNQLQVLKERLGLRHLPRHMECYDISHLGGRQVVGSRVVFVEGRPQKALYRHYRLRDVQRNDDFAALEEVLRRRLKRGLREDDLPDLLVVDGGRPQLERVLHVLRALRLDGLDVAGLAKARSGHQARNTLQHYERLYLPDRPQPLILNDRDPLTHLLQRLRDEAHRFAITYSRRLRKKETLGSVLERIPGVGHRRSRLLLKTFGSVSGVKAASHEELSALQGISAVLAAAIQDWLAENTRDRPLNSPGPQEQQGGRQGAPRPSPSSPSQRSKLPRSSLKEGARK